MKSTQLNEREGIKIRRQFFNGMILNVFSIVVYVLYIISVVDLLNDSFTIINFLDEVKICVFVSLILLVPFIILSILNRHCFGEIICVVSQHGIYYENGFLYWSEIDKLVYDCPILSKHFRYDPCCVEIHTSKGTNDKKIELTYAPLYLLFTAKRVGKNVKIKLSKESKWFIAILSVIFLAFPFVAYVFQLR